MKDMILTFKKAGIIIIFWVLMFAGCRSSTPPMAFYALSPIKGAMADTNPNFKGPPSGKSISIGVGPVDLPDFLNRPQIATRNGSSRIVYSEFHRWGGYLDKNFSRVMAENLSVLLSTNQVQSYPWSDADPTLQVEFNVMQFDGELNGDVVLNVVWRIKDNSKKDRPSISKRSVISEPVNPVKGDEYHRLVLAQSHVLGKLSEEIAKEIKRLY